MEIIHDKEHNKFYLIKDGMESNVKYSMRDEKTIEYWRVYVPSEQRGKGQAAELAEAALNYAIQNNLSVIPSCSYMESYISRNDKFKDLVK